MLLIWRKCFVIINLSNFYTNNVINMSYMFNGCTSLKNLNLSHFNITNVNEINNNIFFGIDKKCNFIIQNKKLLNLYNEMNKCSMF